MKSFLKFLFEQPEEKPFDPGENYLKRVLRVDRVPRTQAEMERYRSARTPSSGTIERFLARFTGKPVPKVEPAWVERQLTFDFPEPTAAPVEKRKGEDRRNPQSGQQLLLPFAERRQGERRIPGRN